MIRYDYHMHSSYSYDSYAAIEDMVEKACRVGLAEIAITDHIEFGFPDKDIASPRGVAANVAKIHKIRDKYENHLSVLAGIELGLKPDMADAAKKIAQTNGLDIIIGSIHDIYSLGFSHVKYFENMLSSITTSDSWDVLGHIDYISRYDNVDKARYYTDYKEVINEILKYIIGVGKGIEINTSRFSGGVHPYPDIIARYKELGGEIITIGSDAHSPEGIAAGFDIAYDMLQNLNIQYTARFRRREPFFAKID